MKIERSYKMKISRVLPKCKKFITSIYKKFIERQLEQSLSEIDKLNLVPKIRQRNLSYLSDKRFIQLISSVQYINENKIKGIFIEAGCALGGSLIIIAGYADNRDIHEYDTFAMIPPPSNKDPKEVHDRYEEIKSGNSQGINGEEYYGYRNNLLDFVKKQIEEILNIKSLDKIQFYKGLLQETMLINEQVSFAHIDVDWYEPVKFCLETIWPKLALNGIMLFDDYFDWGGCKMAVDEYFSTRNDYIFDGNLGSLKIIKTKN